MAVLMSADSRPLSLADFLAWEARQSSKCEYRDGAIFAMAGATDDHGQIVANIIAAIRPMKFLKMSNWLRSQDGMTTE